MKKPVSFHSNDIHSAVVLESTLSDGSKAYSVAVSVNRKDIEFECCSETDANNLAEALISYACLDLRYSA